MKYIKQLLISLLLIGGLGAISTVCVGAESVPNSSGGAQGAAVANSLPDDINGEKQAKASHAKEAFKRDAVCTRCHDESENAPILSIYQTKHGVRGDDRTPTCQNCHGESQKHLGGDKGEGRPAPDFIFKKGVYEKSDESERTGQCLTCHRGAARTNWNGSQHQVGNVACNDCHVVHNPVDKVRVKKTQTQVCFTCHKEQRADSYKTSTHPIEVGKVVCSDCHNPHGSAGPTLLKKNTLNETCFLCHADKRGPVLFEHQPVVENCANCHTPHGSNITPLLKDRPPFLCQECHDGPHASPTVAGPNAAGRVANPGVVTPSANITGRACMNCHVMVHGSNSPAGGFLQR